MNAKATEFEPANTWETTSKQIIMRFFSKWLNTQSLRGQNTRDDAENRYNKSCLDCQNCIYGDKICVNDVEIFDVLTIVGEKLYFCRNKIGFGFNVRDTCSQIINSATLIQQATRERAVGDSGSFFENLYARIINAEGKSFSNFQQQQINSWQDLRDRVSNLTNVVFVFGHLSKCSNVDEALTSIIKTESTIAKLEILRMKRRVEEMGMQFAMVNVLLDQ